mmetsp:Transcript_23454/g.30462  ORF Transcript_23454/g.30462 Transcript_23454/m.30462 type:complete len:570 (-) Transcript_23454:254-1963(-)
MRLLKKPRHKKKKIDVLLAHSETTEINELKDAQSVKLLMLNFEKKVTANARLRIKYSDEPLKFVESELDLNDAIKEMQKLATVPEFYPEVVRLGITNTLATLLEHENSDIRSSILNLLNELTDIEENIKDEAFENIRYFLQAWLSEVSGIELLANLVRNLSSNDDDENKEQQFYDCLAILEHLIEILGSSAADAIAETNLPQILLTRIQNKQFDYNKLYSSEILALLAKYSLLFCQWLVHAKKESSFDSQIKNGMDAILQACNVYRKRSPSDESEEEYIQNLFDILASVFDQIPRQAVSTFIQGEGIDLMCRCAREGKYAATGALKILDIALAVLSPLECSPCAAEKFIQCEGLRMIFRALLGKGAARPPKLDSNSTKFVQNSSKKIQRVKRTSDEARAIEEYILGLIASLCFYAAESEARHEAPKRLLAKLSEPDKLPRLFDLLQNSRDSIEYERRQNLHLSELASYARDLRAGGHALRLAATIITFAAVHSPKCRQLITSQHLDFLPHVLSNYADDLLDFGPDEENEDRKEKDHMAREEATRRATFLKNWAAAIAGLSNHAATSLDV